ncbi:MAG: 3-dehydroquinate synthase [Phycisphaerae bacterium]|nr:3-dehydroquinate synthase [Phycisphaerae bacterium]
MNIVKVKLPAGAARAYDIRIQPGLLDELGRQTVRIAGAGSVVIISDTNVGPLYGARAERACAAAGLRCELLTFPAGEEHKTIATAAKLWDGLAAQSVERATPVVALGGGVVGDVAGFVAACYLRGLPVVQVPTTLLACVDSSVGGKTGVDHPVAGKNMIGAFHQPSGVLIDPLLLASLPQREWSCGLAESVKHAVALDAKFFRWLASRAEQFAAIAARPASEVVRQADTLAELIRWNCRIKAAIVAADEHEAGLRSLLNFGHTTGHAIETLAGFGHVRHGEAVSMGMAVATRIAVGRGLVDSALLDQLLGLLTRMNLPTAVPAGLSPGEIIKLTTKDKKVRGGRVRFVLPFAMGQAKLFDDVTPSELERAIRP